MSILAGFSTSFGSSVWVSVAVSVAVSVGCSEAVSVGLLSHAVKAKEQTRIKHKT